MRVAEARETERGAFKTLKRYYVRMGDGYLEQMTREEIKAELEAGMADASKKAKIAPLSESAKSCICWRS